MSQGWSTAEACRAALLTAAATVMTAAMSVAAASPAVKQVVKIPATPTSIISTTKRMISYRNQSHSWQTRDGAIHLMVNTGTVTGGSGMMLYSSFDQGSTWTPMFSLPQTDASSTSDGMLGTAAANSNVLQLVYSTTNTGGIMYLTATYSAASKSWTPSTPQSVFSARAQLAAIPALSVDAQGNLWCGYTVEPLSTQLYQIEMSYLLVGAKAWKNSGVIVGNVDDSAQHAARPVPFAGGVGMIYQTDDSLYWAYRLSSWPLNQAWTSTLLFVGLPPAGSDPYGTHFNAATDAENNILVAFAGPTSLQYMKYTNSSSTWSAVQQLAPSTEDVTYMKICLADGNVLLMANDETSIDVFQSTDDGDTFQLTQALVHPPAAPSSGLVYSNPRVECPTYSLNPVPTWQQYYGTTDQYLYYFAVPVVN